MIQGKRRNRSSLGGLIAVRPASSGSISAVLLFAFFGLFSVYASLPRYITVLITAALVVSSVSALTDRIVFDGRRLVRVGVAWWIRRVIFGLIQGFSLRSVEQVESFVKRITKRGGRYHYRYRVVIRGRGTDFELDTSVKGHSGLIRSILPQLPRDLLDVRSIELRDFLRDAAEVTRDSREAAIPSPEVLEGAIVRTKGRKRQERVSRDHLIKDGDADKAIRLHRLGNRLRVLGYLLEAAEAFRRALRLCPDDAQLLLDFGRCLEELAGVANDKMMARRSMAVLRLAERRAASDPALLEHLGDLYFSSGRPEHAARAYQKVTVITGNTYRALKGLAEVALYRGKLAHAVMHFSAASENASYPSVRRWSAAEAKYLSRLNESDEYLDVEVGRMNLLNSLIRSAKTCLKIGTCGLPLIIFGLLVGDQLIADIGWAIAAVAFLAFAILSVLSRFFENRIPYEIAEGDE